MSEEIECLESRLVYQNRWLRVREDQVRRPSGHTGIYGVVEKPDFVAIAPIQDGMVYLVQQYRYPVGGRYWELPQGSWEDVPGVDPQALAAAELREETGLVATAIKPVGHLFLAYGFCNQGYHLFHASGLSFAGEQRDAEEEGLVAKAFELADVESMICRGEIKDATTVAAWGLLRMKGLI